MTLAATQLGSAVVASGLSPDEGLSVFVMFVTYIDADTQMELTE